MSGTLALSSLIASLDRAGLASLVHARKIASPNSVHDALDLAGELLKPDSITLALASLNREELAALARFTLEHDTGETTVDRDRLASSAALGLIGGGPSPVPLLEVSNVLAAQLKKHNLSAATLESPPAPRGTPGGSVPDAPQIDTSGWFAQALAASGQVAWLLRDLTRSPGRLNRNGSIASVWVKSVEERLNILQSTELIELTRSAGLTAGRGTSLHAASGDWLIQGHADRWIVLARAAAQLMPAPMRERLAFAQPGDQLEVFTSEFPHLYPLAPTPMLEDIDRAAELWERLGITTGGMLSAAGLAILSDDAQLPPLDFPVAAPGVYIQPDLSVVVPGLLPVEDEALLASLALPEQIGVASTLRLSEASLSDAFDRGMNADSIRDLLMRLSLTGIPQPLDYLITTLAARSGSIIVSIHGGNEGRARIDFVRPDLRASILVDRRLSHLQLHEAAAPATSNAHETTGSTPLFSRLRADHVLAALVDARYPAVADRSVQALGGAPAIAGSGLIEGAEPTANIQQAEDAAASEDVGQAETAVSAAPASIPGANDPHHPREPRERRDTQNPQDPQDPQDPLGALTDRVFEASQSGPSDIGRQITLAIRDKSSIRISVEIRGDTRDFTIVPISLAAGRMRALDETAGVERTLPVEAITSVSQLI